MQFDFGEGSILQKEENQEYNSNLSELFMLIHECSLAVTPCVSQVEDTDLTPATIKMDLLFAFGHFTICAKKS